MPVKHVRHIALTAPLAAYVAEQVEKGEYTSASDLVRTAARRLKAQDQARADRLAPRAAAPAETCHES